MTKKYNYINNIIILIICQSKFEIFYINHIFILAIQIKFSNISFPSLLAKTII
jgi:hypothetical protein